MRICSAFAEYFYRLINTKGEETMEREEINFVEDIELDESEMFGEPEESETPEVETEDTTEAETAIQEESIVEPEETSEEVIVTEEVALPEEESYMEFSDISDVVTAKDVTNLRLTPSTLDDKNIVSQLKNGENVERIGINEASGWSRVEYNGESLYVVSSMIYSTEG